MSQQDAIPAIEAIKARHDQDTPWFTGGLHDPNGYVAMAHADRADLLEHLRRLRTGEHLPPPPNRPGRYIAIPLAAYDWLMGVGPDEQGKHFGDAIEPGAPRYWWRRTFGRMCGLHEKVPK